MANELKVIISPTSSFRRYTLHSPSNLQGSATIKVDYVSKGMGSVGSDQTLLC